MTSEEYLGRRTLDVSKLPATMFDDHSILWWGNNWGLAIETAVFGILIALYFSVWMSMSGWIPPLTTPGKPPLYNPLPDLVYPTIVLVVFLMSLIPAIYIDLAARRRDAAGMKYGMLVTLAFNLVLIVLRYYEFDALHFKWNDNAYGSVVWTTLGAHMTYDLAATLEFGVMGVWVLLNSLDDKHALDVTLAGVYWYWIAATWVLIYAVVYISPRVM